MGLSSSLAIIFLSLSAIPLTYIVNTAQDLHGEVGLLISGVVSLSVLCFITYLIISREGAPRDPLFYVFMLGTFSSVADFIIGLETDKVLSGFMTNYLRDGEPYLQTPHGSLICYWDGIAHYAMYLLMLAAYSWGRSYREIGLYWAGSIGHSMIVFIPGNVVGKFGLRPSFLLNVPYMIFPYWAMARFLRERPKETQLSHQTAQKQHTSIWSRPLDLLLVLGLVTAATVAFLRGFAALDAPNEVFQLYRKQYEPYITDPVFYPKMQMLTYMYQFVPYYVLAVHGLLYPGKSWMPDWALIHAGAAAQAQVAHIGGSLHYRTSASLRVPEESFVRLVFWAINAVLLLLLPQILALRCVSNKRFFTPATAVQNSTQPSKSSRAKKSD